MEPLIYFSFLYAAMLAAAGMVLRRQTQQLVWMYLFLAGAMLVILGAILFPTMNMGRNVALHKFNMTGLDIVLYAALAYTLPSAIYAFLKKKAWPLGVVAVMGLLQVVAVFLLKFYYSRV